MLGGRSTSTVRTSDNGIQIITITEFRLGRGTPIDVVRAWVWIGIGGMSSLMI